MLIILIGIIQFNISYKQLTSHQGIFLEYSLEEIKSISSELCQLESCSMANPFLKVYHPFEILKKNCLWNIFFISSFINN